VFKTESRGWGVRASEDVAAGEYIMEYVGEVSSTYTGDEWVWLIGGIGLGCVGWTHACITDGLPLI
jgi:hypothetical protein